MATAVPPRISDGSDTSSLGVMTGTAAPGSTLDIEGDAFTSTSHGVGSPSADADPSSSTKSNRNCNRNQKLV